MPILKEILLRKDASQWQEEVAGILQYYWTPETLEDLPRRLALLLEEIGKSPVGSKEDILINFAMYSCFLGERKELSLGYAVYEKEAVAQSFKKVPCWENIPIMGEGEEEVFDAMSQWEVRRLLLPELKPKPVTEDLSDLPAFLGAQVLQAQWDDQNRTGAAFLAALLDDYSGRRQMLPAPCGTDRPFVRKWGELYRRVSIYQELKAFHGFLRKN